MTSTLTVAVATRHTTEVRGRLARPVLRRSGVPHLFDHTPPSGGAACWTCPATRTADVIAAASLFRSVRLVLADRQEVLPL